MSTKFSGLQPGVSQTENIFVNHIRVKHMRVKHMRVKHIRVKHKHQALDYPLFA